MVSDESGLFNALRAAQDEPGQLFNLLRPVEDSAVATGVEAREVVALLQRLPRPTPTGSRISDLHCLISLVQGVQTEEAFLVLANEALPELYRLFDLLIDSDDVGIQDDLLFLLKILVQYRTAEGAQRVLRAARRPLLPKDWLWSLTLGQLTPEHSSAIWLLEQLRDPLPPAFLRVALLDAANALAIDGGLGPFCHPFDTPEGHLQLREWLTSSNEDQFSYAHSATASLPFISTPVRDELLALALDHTQIGIQLEGAWAAARLGSESGLKILRRYCCDVNQAVIARHYLEELQRADLIPEEVDDPVFRARAEFSNWLAHPSELGRPPDAVEVLDHRSLNWPPEGEPRELYLVKYTLRKDDGSCDVDCGLVGSVTFCLFGWQNHRRPPTDAYAIHCAWEMESRQLIDSVDYRDDQQPANLPAELHDWPGDPLVNPRVVQVSQMLPELGYPQAEVTLLEGSLYGQAGWLVLDGPRSRWYPQSDMPPNVASYTVLLLHVGRVLLGFSDEPDRRQYLADTEPGSPVE